jgi:hypothetical protein
MEENETGHVKKINMQVMFVNHDLIMVIKSDHQRGGKVTAYHRVR